MKIPGSLHCTVRRLRDWLGVALAVLPPTALGWLVLALSCAVFWFAAVRRLDLVLFVLSLAGAILTLTAALVVGITALIVRRRLCRSAGAQPPLLLEAGRICRTGFLAPALAWVPFVKLEWQWSEPARTAVEVVFQDGGLTERITPERRHRGQRIARTVSLADVFGLNRVSWSQQTRVDVTVLPDCGRLRELSVARAVAGGEAVSHPAGAPRGDRMEFRKYTPRDPVRDIVWTMYARSRQLNVRTPERAVAPSVRVAGYLLSGPGDEPAAAAARVAVEGAALGEDWIFGADGTDQPARDRGSALDAIARSGSWSGAPGLIPFLERVHAEGPFHCVAFIPAVGGEWLPALLEAAGRYAGSLSAVVGLDGIARRGSQPLWKRVLLTDTEACRRVSPDDLGALLRELGSAGITVTVADRSGGGGGSASQRLAAVSVGR